MSNIPKIDITGVVMGRIESGEVKMHSRSYFMAKKITKMLGLVVIGLFILSTVFYTVVIIQNGVFKEYLEFGKQGASHYWGSIPWGAVVVAILLTAVMSLGIYLLQLKKRLVSTIGITFAVVILMSAMVFKIGPDPANSSFAKAVMSYNNNPAKISGIVEQNLTENIIIHTSDGRQVKVIINPRALGDREFAIGDEILVLGNKRDGNIEADALKIIKRAEKHIVVKQEQPTKNEPSTEAKPGDPKPEQQPAVSAPIAVSPAPTPSVPIPPAPSEYITLSVGSGLPAGGPFTKYEMSWSANFSAKYKLIWSTSPSPVWPSSHYWYVGTSTSSATGIVKKDMGPGIYYVRVCRYDSSNSTCDLYSNQVSVTFN